jgi:hypothetical protein
MASEINTKDQLAAMLSAKLNEFLDGVSDSYGKVILDELVARLEYTVTDFKDEVGDIMEQMLENAANKKEILADLIARETKPDVAEEVTNGEASEGSAGESDREMSEWEKKLEQLG